MRRPMYKLFTDGASRGNPGAAGAGAALYAPDGELVMSLRAYLGVQTCNIAEYAACVLGCRVARAMRVAALECCADSELLVRQMNGEYQVRNGAIRTMYTRLGSLKDGFEEVEFVCIPRHLNSVADRLANEGIDGAMPFDLWVEPAWKERFLHRVGLRNAVKR